MRKPASGVVHVKRGRRSSSQFAASHEAAETPGSAPPQRPCELGPAARLLQNANGFFLSVILVRKFGLASAGVYALAAAAVMPIAILGTFGLPFSLARATEGLREKNMIGALACGLAMPFSLPLIVPFGIALDEPPTKRQRSRYSHAVAGSSPKSTL